MKKPFETPFNNIIKKNINAIPDHILENMNNLCSKILESALWNKENKMRIDPNLSLGAIQKALSLIIAQFFPKEMVPEISDRIGHAIKISAIEFSKKDLSKEFE